MNRPDITDWLVHFIRGKSLDESFAVLRKILSERRLCGGNGYIKGLFQCVCFSEAPFPILGHALSRGYAPSVGYQPVGILVLKSWLFRSGGRPVIYQTDAEFSQLPEGIRWRHVRYDPTDDPPIDFTWEREWRIQTSELRLDPTVTEVVVPSRDYMERLLELHEREQDFQEHMYTEIFDEMTAWQYREDFPWRCRTIKIDGAATQ